MNTAAVARAATLTIAFGCARGASPSQESIMQTGTYEQADAVPRMQAERIGHGRPLVLVGGGLTGWASWQQHAERLAGERDVARLQLLSVQYGLEQRPLPADYSVRFESRALGAALDALDWHEAVDLVAWSYGALVTLDFALNHPDRVRTLTLIEPPALWLLPDHGRALPDVRTLEALLPDFESDDVSIDALRSFLHTAALVPPGAKADELPQWETWVRHRQSLRNTRAPFMHSDDQARVQAYKGPVLLVTGRGTSTFLRRAHDTLAQLLPNARTLELPGGHAPQLAAPDEFLLRLAEFQSARDAGPVDPGPAPS